MGPGYEVTAWRTLGRPRAGAGSLMDGVSPEDSGAVALHNTLGCIPTQLVVWPKTSQDLHLQAVEQGQVLALIWH